MKKNIFTFLFVLGCATWLNAQVQATYFVDPSPSGSDSNPGTQNAPFATLAKARDVVRTINSSMSGDIIINLRGGTHLLSSTFTLSSTDHGTNGHAIIYQAYPNEIPVVSGGIKISGWTLHDGGKNIYKASVGTSVDTRQLYVNGKRAIRARSNIDNHFNSGSNGWTQVSDGYTCPAEVASWGNLTAVEVCSDITWHGNRGRIASVSGTRNHGSGVLEGFYK